MKYIHIFCEDSLRVCVAIVNKFLYFFVNDACDFLAEASGVTEVTSEEYFIPVRTYFLKKSVLAEKNLKHCLKMIKQPRRIYSLSVRMTKVVRIRTNLHKNFFQFIKTLCTLSGDPMLL